MQALYELSVGLSTTNSATQVATRTVSITAAQLQATVAVALGYDRRADRFVVLDATGAAGELSDALALGSAPAGAVLLEVAASGVTAWVGDRAELRSVLPAVAGAFPDLAALVVLPVRAAGATRVIGSLLLGFDDARRPAAGERQFLAVVGELAGQALARARSRAAELDARRAAAVAAERNARVAALTAALVPTVTAEQVAAVLAEHVQQALECQTFTVRQIDPEARVARALHVGGTPADYPGRFADVALDRPSALAEVVATGRAVFVASAQENQDRWGSADTDRYTAARIEAMARLPLAVEDRLIAVLSVGWWAPRSFEPADRLFLSTVADVAAQALGRAMRTQRLTSEARRARGLGALAAALVEAVSVAEVGQVLSAHVQSAMAADAFSLRLLDRGQGVARTLCAGGAALHNQDRHGDVDLSTPSALAEVVATRERYGEQAAERYEAAHVEAIARFPLLVEDELVAVLSVGYWQAREFDEPERLFLGTIADLAAQALGRAIGTQRLRAEARRHRLLSGAQAAINRRLDPAAQLQALSQVVVPELADFSSVNVLAEPLAPGQAPPLPVITDRVASTVVTGVASAPLQSGISWWDGDPITETVREGRLLTRPWPTPQIPPWAARTGTADTFSSGLNHLVLAPVLVDGLVVAVACFGMCNQRPAWGPQDLEIIEEIAEYAAVALEHGLSFQHTRETALVLQHALLSTTPQVEGVAICGRYRPAGRDQVGGDWYDATAISPGHLALAVGDVVGHDIRAAAAMGQMRAALRTLALQQDNDPGQVLDGLAATNTSLRMTAFATAVFARLTRTGQGWTLAWANAGHPPPLLVGPDGSLQVLWEPSGLALVPGSARPRATGGLDLAAGSTLLLYTDGLVERRGEDLRAGIAALADTVVRLRRSPLEELCDALLHDCPSSDDVAALAVRVGD